MVHEARSQLDGLENSTREREGERERERELRDPVCSHHETILCRLHLQPLETDQYTSSFWLAPIIPCGLSEAVLTLCATTMLSFFFAFQPGPRSIPLRIYSVYYVYEVYRIILYSWMHSALCATTILFLCTSQVLVACRCVFTQTFCMHEVYRTKLYSCMHSCTRIFKVPSTKQ